MTGRDAPPDFHAVVRTHHRDTRSMLLALGAGCDSVRDFVVSRVRGRDLVALEEASLASLTPPASWLLGVLLCPGASTATLAAWVLRLAPPALERVRFYAHLDVDVEMALEGWRLASLDEPAIRRFSDWRSFFHEFGRELNERVYEDFGREGWPR